MDLEMILASASPRRRELLAQIGLTFTVIPSKGEEVMVGETPAEIVKGLSREKAREVAREHKHCIVIGADTVVANQNRILGKPVSKADAVEMIKGLQGGSHEVYTGVTLIRKDFRGLREVSFAEETKVFVYPMTADEICSYVDSNEPMDKAGAYGIQGLFGAYIKRIEGDYTNVVGLPVGRLYQELKQLI